MAAKRSDEFLGEFFREVRDIYKRQKVSVLAKKGDSAAAWYGDVVFLEFSPLDTKLLWSTKNPKPFRNAITSELAGFDEVPLLARSLSDGISKVCGDPKMVNDIFVNEYALECLEALNVARQAPSDIEHTLEEILRDDRDMPFDSLNKNVDWRPSLPLSVISNPSDFFFPELKRDKLSSVRTRIQFMIEMACLGPWYGIPTEKIRALIELAATPGDGTKYASINSILKAGRILNIPLYSNGYQGRVAIFAGRNPLLEDKVEIEFEKISAPVKRTCKVLADWLGDRRFHSAYQMHRKLISGKAGSDPELILESVVETVLLLCSPLEFISATIGNQTKSRSLQTLDGELNGYSKGKSFPNNGERAISISQMVLGFKLEISILPVEFEGVSERLISNSVEDQIRSFFDVHELSNNIHVMRSIDIDGLRVLVAKEPDNNSSERNLALFIVVRRILSAISKNDHEVTIENSSFNTERDGLIGEGTDIRQPLTSILKWKFVDRDLKELGVESEKSSRGAVRLFWQN